MQLKDKLYTIKQRNGSWFRIKLIRDCVIYRAHFPELPVTPGVCIIQIASELMESAHDTRLELVKVSNAKFLNVINPDITEEVTYDFTKETLNEEEKTAKIAVDVKEGSLIFARLSLVYRIND